MISAPPPPNEPYIVGDLEVCVVEEPSRRVRPPNPSERVVLEALFNNPEMYNDEGRPYHLHGLEVAGVNGLVVTYALRRAT